MKKALKFLGFLSVCLPILLISSTTKAQTQQGLKSETKQWKQTINRTIYVNATGRYSTQPPININFTTAIISCNVYTYSTECDDCPNGGTCSCTYIPAVPPSPTASACGYPPFPPVTPPPPPQ